MNELEYRNRIIREGLAVLKNQRRMIEDLKREIKTVDLQFVGKTVNGLSIIASPDILMQYETPDLAKTKLYQKVREMILPYNSFFGISNDLRCFSNKQDTLPFDQIL